MHGQGDRAVEVGQVLRGGEVRQPLPGHTAVGRLQRVRLREMLSRSGRSRPGR